MLGAVGFRGGGVSVVVVCSGTGGGGTTDEVPAADETLGTLAVAVLSATAKDGPDSVAADVPASIASAPGSSDMVLCAVVSCLLFFPQFGSAITGSGDDVTVRTARAALVSTGADGCGAQPSSEERRFGHPPPHASKTLGSEGLPKLQTREDKSMAGCMLFV